MSEARRRRTPEPVRPAGAKTPTPSTAPAAAAETEIDLAELFFRLLDAWKWIILAVVVGMGIAYGVESRKTPAYRATSTIYVIGTGTDLTLTTLQVGNYMMQDYVQVFDIWEVQDQVIRNLGLDMSYRDLRDMITVTNPSNTRMLNISASSADPELAANVANEFATVVSNYISDTMKTDKPSIMSVALVPTNPYNISRLKAMLIGAMLGFLIVAAVVTVIMLTDDRVKNAEDIYKYTGLTNLAIVPLNRGDDQPSVGKKVRV